MAAANFFTDLDKPNQIFLAALAAAN
ncbi:hypothetical protein THIOSC13_360003 [uncultured Thiomicrorhabdus sp.]